MDLTRKIRGHICSLSEISLGSRIHSASSGLACGTNVSLATVHVRNSLQRSDLWEIALPDWGLHADSRAKTGL